MEQEAKITVKALDSGMLDAWIDFNDDGDWVDAGEQIFISQALIKGSNALLFTVPGDAKPTSQTFARFRFSSKGGLSFAGVADDGEVEDYEVEIIGYDFGDAPDDPQNLDDYPTLLESSGARHKIKPEFYLGKSVDIEGDGQPDPKAEGDDKNGIDDEDGVMFSNMPLIVCRQDTVTVTASQPGMLDAWIDFNDDGDWADAGEQIFKAQPLVVGANVLIFTVPSDAKPTSQTFARFRFSSKGGLSFAGVADDGEVEDYEVEIIGYDFGDAPDDPQNPDDYPTLLVSDGACHKIRPGFFLGKSIDAETDGQPNASATGDDDNGIDDEDGVVFTTPLIQCQPTKVTITASDSGMLDAWIDFNGDNDWADAGEQIFTGQPLSSGQNNLSFLVPYGTTPPSQTFARFRFSSKGNLSFNGTAEDGEVEDYEVKISDFDFGDAPDDSTNPNDYPTFSKSNGAHHKIKPGYFLGSSIDSEADGQPHTNALGDDSNGVDDEDGIVFSTPLVQCQHADITVTASDSGKLDAWIDFNADGN